MHRHRAHDAPYSHIRSIHDLDHPPPDEYGRSLVLQFFLNVGKWFCIAFTSWSLLAIAVFVVLVAFGIVSLPGVPSLLW